MKFLTVLVVVLAAFLAMVSADHHHHHHERENKLRHNRHSEGGRELGKFKKSLKKIFSKKKGKKKKKKRTITTDDTPTDDAPTDDAVTDDDIGGAPSALPPTPAVTGDPHFVMWNGNKFDFHGGCDLVLLQNPDFNNGEGLYIHIRTKIQRWWSYVDSAVVQIGDDTLEVMGGVENKRYFVNGKPGDKIETSGMLPFTIGGYNVRYRHLNEKQFQFKIFLDDGQNIVLKAVKDFMRVDVENPTVESFGNSVGLMGSFEGGKMLARDGVTILEDANAFGKEWQVLRTEPMLFHNVEGVQHPEACAMPTMSEEKRRLEGSISREMAERACAKVPVDEIDDCVFDVMATNDIDLAGAF